MDLSKYFDQTKNLLDFYIKKDDYKSAFKLLIKSLSQVDESYFKNLVNLFEEKCENTENNLIENKEIENKEI